MIVYGVEMEDIAALANELGMYLVPKPHYANGWGFALRPQADRWLVVLEADERHGELRVVCQHGHEKFIQEALTRWPLARIETALAKYQNLEQFERIQPTVRAAYDDRYGVDPCTCEEEEEP